MTTTTATTNNKTPAPLYVRFAQVLKDICLEETGLEPTAAPTETGLPQNGGYFFVEFGPHGGDTCALIVPRSKTRMGTCHVHVDCSDLEGWVDDGGKAPGKVISFFVPDAELLRPVIRRLAGASKRPNRSASGRTVVKTVAPAVDVFGPPLEEMLELASAPGSYATSEESEAELQTTAG